MRNDHVVEIIGVNTIKKKMFDDTICTLQYEQHVKK